jgi:putative membrane protein
MAVLDLKAASEKSLSLIVYAVSIVVIALVGFMMLFPQALSFGSGVDVKYLPPFHAFLNGSTAVLLASGFAAILKKNVRLHKTLMVSAFMLSSLFLISYVIYHSQAPSTKFGGDGAIRGIYFFILITHIVLASVILPLALFTITRAWRAEFTKHKRIARWTLPLWLYVAVTGVVVYLMMRPYYAFN